MRRFYGRVEPRVRINRDLEFLEELKPVREFKYKECPNCGGSHRKLKLLPWPHLVYCNVCPEGQALIAEEKRRKEHKEFIPKNTKSHWR